MCVLKYTVWTSASSLGQFLHTSLISQHTLPWSPGAHAAVPMINAKVPRAKKTLIEQEASNALFQCQGAAQHCQQWPHQTVIGWGVHWTERGVWFCVAACANTSKCTPSSNFAHIWWTIPNLHPKSKQPSARLTTKHSKDTTASEVRTCVVKTAMCLHGKEYFTTFYYITLFWSPYYRTCEN
jgi:hypothetical protein